MKTPPTITDPEMQTLLDAEEMINLRNYAPFMKLRALMATVVQDAHDQMEKNRDREKAYDLQLIWSQRKIFLQFIDDYIEVVASKRRDAVRSLLEALGVSPEGIERSLDMSAQGLHFIQQKLGGQNGTR